MLCFLARLFDQLPIDSPTKDQKDISDLRLQSFMGFVSFMVKFVILLLSLHPGTCFSLVILRSPANSGTTKNLEILRCAQDDRVERFSRRSA